MAKRERHNGDDRLTARAGDALRGTLAVPGDKSVSHRALLLAGLSVGETTVTGLLEGADVLATAAALRQLGVPIERDRAGPWHVWGRGVGGLAAPRDVVDLGNAGTAARLLLGALAGHPFAVVLTGDRSLRQRPMGRVIAPLREMGATFTAGADRLPLTVTGSVDLLPIEYPLPVPSAQVKSAVLLAGLHAPGATTVVEDAPTRDHTERLLRHFGAAVTVAEDGAGGRRRVTVAGEPELAAADVAVPGDPSSAAFVAVAATLIEGSDVTITGVLANPTRTGLYDTLAEMGADIEWRHHREVGGEPVADLRVRAGPLHGTSVPAARAPSMIDEFPILAIAAAAADGPTTMAGLAELRVKESDRLATIADGLAACGVDASAGEDTLVVRGNGAAPPGGATIDSALDHRIAMSFLVCGLAAARPVSVVGAAAIDTSFPGFAAQLRALGADIAPSTDA